MNVEKPLATSRTGILAVQDLSFSYAKGMQPVICGFSHAFAVGELTALTGISGRGKTTLLYLLGLLLRPTSGQVRLLGQDAGTLSDSRRSSLRAENLGFIFQDAELDPSRTIAEAVMEPGLYAGIEAQERRSRALQMLNKMGLAERSTHRPGQISGGQAQRVAIARALMNDPSVILADEPTGNLDRGNAQLVLDTLRDLCTERTVVIATHDPFVLEHADNVVRL